jgi:cytidylate kinase
MNSTSPVIAIDGPAAAGKTTVSTAIAARFGLGYVESGRTYRLSPIKRFGSTCR